MKIGLLGGGQLGRMFIQNALNYPVEVFILDPNLNAPCAQFAHEFVLGDFNSFDDVFSFGKRVDVIGIEIEQVNIEALEALKKLGKTVIPDPAVLRTIQDKLIQKEFYFDHQIPTAPILSDLQFPLVQKMRRGGYDGKGVKIIESKADLDDAFSDDFFYEEKANIDKELAVILAKNQRGEIIIFDVVEQVFDSKLNLLDYLLSPADIDHAKKEQCKKIAQDFVQKINSPGIFAIEFFLNRDGSIWVNEIAPRVHNSGHATIESTNSSQFDVMLRVLMNLPLVEPKSEKHSAMINLIGKDGYTGRALLSGFESAVSEPDVYIHWYGKEFTNPGRKMGHCTILSDSKEELIRKTKRIKQSLAVISKEL